MKLKPLNPQTVPSRAPKTSRFISFGSNSLMSLNEQAQQLLELSVTDTIEILLGEEDSKQVFITKSTKGFKLRKKTVGEHLCFSSKSAKTMVFDFLGLEVMSKTFSIKPEPIKTKGYPHPLFEINVD